MTARWRRPGWPMALCSGLSRRTVRRPLLWCTTSPTRWLTTWTCGLGVGVLLRGGRARERRPWVFAVAALLARQELPLGILGCAVSGVAGIPGGWCAGCHGGAGESGSGDRAVGCLGWARCARGVDGCRCVRLAGCRAARRCCGCAGGDAGSPWVLLAAGQGRARGRRGHGRDRCGVGDGGGCSGRYGPARCCHGRLLPGGAWAVAAACPDGVGIDRAR